MGIIIRQSIWISVFSYLGVLIGYLNVIYLLPEFLDVDQIGALRFIQNSASLLLPVVHLGISPAILRYQPILEQAGAKRSGFIPFMTSFSTLIYLVLLLGYMLFKEELHALLVDQVPAIAQYAGLILLMLFLLNLTRILETYSRSLLKAVFVNALKDTGIRLFTALLVLGYATGRYGFYELLLYITLIYVFNIGLILISLVRQKAVYWSLNLDFLKMVDRRELFLFIGYTFLGSTGSILFRRIDSLMITLMKGLYETGIYGNMFNIAQVIEIPRQSITQISMPVISKAFAERRIDAIADVYRKSSINQQIIGSLLLIGIWVNLPNLYRIMPKGDEFALGYWVVVLVGVSKLVEMMAGNSSELLNMSPHYRFNMLSMLVMCVIAVGLNYLMIPAYGITGAAVATLITVMIHSLAKGLFLRFRYQIQPFSGQSILVLAIALGVLLPALWLPLLDAAFLDIIIRSGLVTVVYGLLILLTKASPEANGLVNQVLVRLGIKYRF